MSAAGASQSVFDYLIVNHYKNQVVYLQPHEFRGEIEFNNVSLVYPARSNEIAIQVN